MGKILCCSVVKRSLWNCEMWNGETASVKRPAPVLSSPRHLTCFDTGFCCLSGTKQADGASLPKNLREKLSFKKILSQIYLFLTGTIWINVHSAGTLQICVFCRLLKIFSQKSEKWSKFGRKYGFVHKSFLEETILRKNPHFSHSCKNLTKMSRVFVTHIE